MQNEKLHLPLSWDGKDFETALSELLEPILASFRSYYELYQDRADYSCIRVDVLEIASICGEIKSCVREYHSGVRVRRKSPIRGQLNQPILGQ